MWIAKPLQALSSVEKEAWSRTLALIRARDEDAPLAQTFAWGNAIEAMKGQAYLVFSPEESAGGLLFSSMDSNSRKLKFECINGPLLAWDDSESAPRQLATFAMATAKLDPARFGSLILKPRWLEGQSVRRLPGLPVPVFARSAASTLKLALTSETEARFSTRLKRTLRTTEKSMPQTKWSKPETEEITLFFEKMRVFSKLKGFTTPPLEWFTALLAGPDLSFRLVTVDTGGAHCQLLIALHGNEAHYLFGHEFRIPGTRAAISPSAIAHRLAIREARNEGMKLYDFNGYLENATGSYAGVCGFKEQFGADLVRYEVPEFRIE